MSSFEESSRTGPFALGAERKTFPKPYFAKSAENVSMG